MNLAATVGAAVGALAVFAVALVAGWAAPGLPPAPVLALVHGRSPDPAPPLRRPGGDLIFARDGLVGELGSDPASNPVVHTRFGRPAGPPPPPPPDVALVFRREASAVVREPGRGLALQLTQPGQASRTIRPGHLFDHRWRLASLTMAEAVLSDGVVQRRISLFAGPGATGAFVQ